jgi:prevent-host-death family protein
MKEFEINVTEARTRFADVLNRAAYEGGRVLIARRGMILCAVISFNELTRLRALPPEPDPAAEAERYWQEGKRALEEKLQRLNAERAVLRKADEVRREAQERIFAAEEGRGGAEED